MKRSYGDELTGLSAAYTAALDVPDSEVEALRAVLAGAPAVFVGAGGALALAKFAAELHERFCGSLARAATPLEITSLLFPITSRWSCFPRGRGIRTQRQPQRPRSKRVVGVWCSSHNVRGRSLKAP